MTWILIWFALAGISKPTPTASAEFNSYENCQQAGKAIEKLTYWGIKWVCVQK